jgi:hypothetical protein
MNQALPKEQASKDPHQAVRSILSSLLLAIKMSSLYAEDHSHCQKALSRLHVELEDFINKREALVLEVNDKQLLYLGDVVHQGQGKDGELPFALFRDGILTLAFTQGLEFEETRLFVKILERYKSLPTDAEGDIVTALWEAEMPHIEYQAVDNILEVDGLSETRDRTEDWLGSMSPGGKENLSPYDMHEEAQDSSPTDREARRFPLIEPTLLQLTEEEARKLESMVRTEEERDATQEILNMLADILKQQQEEDFFSYVLDYMVDELRTAFSRKDFDIALRILKTLNHIHKLCREAGPWAVSRVRKFLLRISEPDFLEGLKEGWNTVSNAQIARAREVLLFLPPDSILQLGAMLREVPVPVRVMLADVVLMLAARDIRPFQEMLDASDENLLKLLVPLLAKMEGERSARTLLNMLQKPSETIRKEALRAVILRRLWAPQALAPLLDDLDPSIRQLTVRYLGSRKNEVAEALLIDHLKRGKPPGNSGQELIACFKTLGKCGTSEAIPFLNDTLLKGGLISRFRDSLRRRGAALALLGLNSEQSKAVLEKACRSRFPGVRNAAQSVYRTQGEYR